MRSVIGGRGAARGVLTVRGWRGKPAPRDPSPSRLAYRVNRLMLTPLFQRALTFGLPLLAAAVLLSVFAADAERRAGIAAWVADARAAFEHREAFMVRVLTVEGASPDLASAVRAAAGIALPVSSFHLDLAAAQARVAVLDPVAGADLRIRPGGTLEIRVTQREPVVLWRMDGGLEMLDPTGARVASVAARADRADLPLIVGEGASAHVAEALEVLTAAAPLADRVRGLTRIGGRRWDVVLDRGQTILLPETHPARALEAVIALHRARDLLNRDVVRVDMRDPRRPTVRMGAENATLLRAARTAALGEN